MHDDCFEIQVIWVAFQVLVKYVTEQEKNILQDFYSLLSDTASDSCFAALVWGNLFFLRSHRRLREKER